MKAVHLRLTSPCDTHEEAFIEMLVRLIEGVEDVATIRSLHLISVLYDERLANVQQIVRSLGRAGFAARVYNTPYHRTAMPAA